MRLLCAFLLVIGLQAEVQIGEFLTRGTTTVLLSQIPKDLSIPALTPRAAGLQILMTSTDPLTMAYFITVKYIDADGNHGEVSEISAGTGPKRLGMIFLPIQFASIESIEVIELPPGNKNIFN